MIDVTDRKDKCFAFISNQCTILTATECEKCKFYKPRGCEDWVRLNIQDRIIMVEPEEYARLKGARHEQNV